MEVDTPPASSADDISPGEKLERYFLRLALLDSDEKLQKFTDNNLIDILQLAGSEPALLNKSRELLTHFNRRVRTNMAIGFPVQELLNLIAEASPVTSSLAIVYLRFARERISAEQHIECLPHYVKAISNKLGPNSKMVRQELLALTVPGWVALASVEKSKWPKLELDGDVKGTLIRFFYCIITFSAGSIEEVEMVSRAIKDGSPTPSLHSMSPDEYFFIAEKVVGDKLQLVPVKCALLKLLGNGLVDDPSAFPLFVVATGMNLNAVEDLGEGALKRIDINECLSSRSVVDTLMGIYLGSAATTAKLPLNETVLPAGPLVKQKVVTQLIRSEVAATAYMNNIKIALDALSITSTKLQMSGLQYLLAISAKMPPSARPTLAPALMTRVKRALNEANSTQVESLAYRCVAELGKLHPNLVFSDLSFVQHAFEEIAQAPEDLVYSIVDCLTAWLPLFLSHEDVTTRNILEKLIGTYVIHENPKCRLVSLKYIEALLRPDEMELKWMLLRACGDSRDEMRGEAVRLLEISLQTALPTVELAIQCLWEKIKDGITVEGKPEDDDKRKLQPQQVIHMVCQYVWAICEAATGEKAQLRIIEGDELWKTVTPKVVKLLNTINPTTLHNFQTVCLAAVRETQDTHILRVATACMLAGQQRRECTSVSQQLSTRALSSTRLDYASAAAFLSALLLPEDDLLPTAESTVEAFCAKHDPIPGSAWVSSCLVAGVSNRVTVLKTAQNLVARLLTLIEEGYHRPSSMLDASVGALSQLLQKFHSKNVSLSVVDYARVLEICSKIAGSRKDGLSTRSREASVTSIGYLVSNATEDVFEKVITNLYEVAAGPPQPELQFVVGGSLFDAALGQHAPSRRNEFLEKEDDIVMDSIPDDERKICEQRLLQIFNTVVDEKLEAASHHVRRAGLIWLYVICQRATNAKCSLLSNLLDRAQAAFADGLTENDDFTQDVASKGVGLVYAQANTEQRKALVAELVAALSEGRRVARQITGETKLFEKGQLGKSPDGENLTTYKELCSLATDLNQPDLLYKFMQLAKHNASWNAKKGAAFGFGVVFEQARSELDPYVGQLVPKLFRYRYDPDSKVQASMKAIWSVLTSTRKNVVDEHADEIAKELIPNLTHKEWRVRESSCLALSDLLRGHDTPWMHAKVPELIDIVLRVRDDIKESVRVAAERTTESLRKSTVKLASSNAQQGEKARQFIAILLPILIEKGVHSSVKANKAFSLSLLMELAREAGAQMKPWLHEIIPCLLDAISDSEHSVLNYIATRSDEQQLEALDDARARMARTSPMMTAVHDLLPQIDADVITRLQPSLCDQLRGSIGMSTRTAAAQLITHLSLRAPQQMLQVKQVCDKLFAALRPGLRDRNPTVRKQFGSAMSYLAKFVSNKQLDTLMKMVTEDLIGESEEQKSAVRVLLKSFSGNCSELLSSYAPNLIPYVFLEKCKPVIPGDEASKRKSEDWNELWGELVPSTEAAVRLYCNEIIACGMDILQNNTVWAVRAQAAQMIGDCVRSMGESLDGQKAVSLLASLLPLLSGRLWEGKAKVVNAVEATLDVAGLRLRDTWTEAQRDETVTVLKREASKRNKEYKVEALRAMAVLAERTENVEAADWVRDAVRVVVEKVNNIADDAEESSSDEGLTNTEKEARMTKFLTAHIVAATIAMRAYREAEDVTPSVALVAEVLSSPQVYWKVKQETVAGVNTFVENNRVSGVLECSNLCESLIGMAADLETQRRSIAIQAIHVVRLLADQTEAGGKVKVDWNKMVEKLTPLKTASDTGLLKKVQQLVNQ